MARCPGGEASFACPHHRLSGLPGDSFNADLLGVDRALLKPVSPETLVQEVGRVFA
jgi:hypothetical protein